MRRVLTLLLAVGAVCGLPARAASLPHYHVARHIPLPGNESWDYLFADSTDHRLYIAHGSVVQVLDLVHETLAGAYHSVFKGRGMAFSEVRPYQPGDEIRTIDWTGAVWRKERPGR